MATSVTSPGSPPPLKRQMTASQAEEEAKEEVQKYTFFNRKQAAEANRNGDIYDEKLQTTQKEWAIER